MKKVITLFLLSTLVVFTYGQALKAEKCKCTDVQLMEYSGTLPKSTVIVKINDLSVDRPVNQLDQLSEKEIKKIKKWARKFKSCTVYVDFNHSIIDKKLNPSVSDKQIFYMIVLDME
nr:hypothetical protein [uncultured Carboxylicivirga sp.]